MLHRTLSVLLATVGPLACVTTNTADPDPIEDAADSSREAPPTCAALVTDDDGDPDAKLRMLAELHDATSPGDPDLPVIELRLARAAIAVGLLGSGCDALQRAHAHGDAEVVAAASEAIEHCCVDVPPTTAAPAPAPVRCERRDAEAACDEDGDAACCMVATIKYEYEWLEARKGGDVEAARTHEARYLELLERACHGDHAAACDQLTAHRDMR